MVPSKPPIAPDVCCNQSACNFVRADFYTCARTCDQNPNRPSAPSVGCTDPARSCRIVSSRQDICTDPNSGEELSCIDTVVYSCCLECGPEGDGATCSDGIDNDGDSFTDCEEPDCANQPHCNPPTCGPRPTPAPCGAGYFPTRRWYDYLTCAWSNCIPLPPSGGGGCMEARISPENRSLKDPTLNFTNPGCCDDYERLSCYNGGGQWNEASCTCASPIVIDVVGNGFNLTNALRGVLFDLNRTGTAERFSWTAADSDDAWLVFDRNGNGIIDDGKELFGSSTPQPYLAKGETKHGFRALALLDTAAFGGNSDGQIDNRDSIFYSLKLWRDRNHNGFSEAAELQSLSGSVISVIQLKYKESRHKDGNGNWFRYRARVTDANGSQAGRWAWDVFLQRLD
jgi:hypothetical protein